MKKLSVLIFFIGFFYYLPAQTDSSSVVNRISEMELSKSDLISKGRRLLLSDLEKGNVQGVKDIVEYLTMKVEDEDHLAFWAIERLMLYFWIGDYTQVLNWALYLSSKEAEKQRKPLFTPSDDMIGGKMTDLVKEEYSLIRDDFKSLKFSQDTEDFLSLFLDRLLVVYDSKFVSIDKINENSDRFVKTYPDSPLSKVVKETVSYKFRPGDWQWGISLGGGVHLDSGNMTDHIDFSQGAFVMMFDVFYKKFYFGLGLTAFGGNAREDIRIKSKDQVWPKGEFIPVTMCYPVIGFKALEYKRLKLTPFAGVSFNFAKPSEEAVSDNPDLKGLSFGTSVTPLVGFDLDFSLTDLTKVKPRTDYNPNGCFLVGLKGMYMPGIITNQGSNLTGNMFMLGLSVKVLFFQLKRVY
ncbi:MAG: hypothetical protein LBU57_07400 [Dysgonamonadaceae bacterium]|jgi:hypothetical protein|nr:hypothetical protein [Dysgonamonadaceae bacterium]